VQRLGRILRRRTASSVLYELVTGAERDLHERAPPRAQRLPMSPDTTTEGMVAERRPRERAAGGDELASSRRRAGPRRIEALAGALSRMARVAAGRARETSRPAFASSWCRPRADDWPPRSSSSCATAASSGGGGATAGLRRALFQRRARRAARAPSSACAVVRRSRASAVVGRRRRAPPLLRSRGASGCWPSRRPCAALAAPSSWPGAGVLLRAFKITHRPRARRGDLPAALRQLKFCALPTDHAAAEGGYR